MQLLPRMYSCGALCLGPLPGGEGRKSARRQPRRYKYPMRCELDHLVVACADLQQGAAWARDRLGVDVQPGGKHASMGTHNLLLRIGPRVYLELIAIDPDAAPPERPRWFELDTRAVRTRVAERPFLATWVARCDKLVDAVTRVPELGNVRNFSRGQFVWRFALPDNGAVPFGGVMPAVMQWDSQAHPTDVLENRGCDLIALELAHPAATSIVPLFRALRIAGPVDVKPGPKSLVARLYTPRGDVALS